MKKIVIQSGKGGDSVNGDGGKGGDIVIVNGEVVLLEDGQDGDAEKGGKGGIVEIEKK